MNISFQKISALALFLICTVTIADEREDFGFRTTGGVITGIGDSAAAEISFWADFYFLSPDFRMLFGFNLFDPTGGELPAMDLQALGIEYNFKMPFLTGQKLLLGARYNKTYMQSERANYRPKRGMSYHVGYKYPLVRFQDLVFELGRQYRPVDIINDDPNFPIDSLTYFVRAGWEIYF